MMDATRFAVPAYGAAHLVADYTMNKSNKSCCSVRALFVLAIWKSRSTRRVYYFERTPKSWPRATIYSMDIGGTLAKEELKFVKYLNVYQIYSVNLRSNKS